MHKKLLSVILSVGLITGIGIVGSGSASAAPKPAGPSIAVSIQKPATPVAVLPNFSGPISTVIPNLVASSTATKMFAKSPRGKAAIDKAVLDSSAMQRAFCANIAQVGSVTNSIAATSFVVTKSAGAAGLENVAGCAAVVGSTAATLDIGVRIAGFFAGC